MGGFCSKRSTVDKSPSDSSTLHTYGFRDHEPKTYHPHVKSQSNSTPPMPETMENPFSFPERAMPASVGVLSGSLGSQVPQMSRTSSQNSRSTESSPAASSKIGATKVSEMSSRLGKAGTVGLGKAVEVLDTLGSSMTSLNHNNGFVLGTLTKGNKISILAFEVANTIVKGSNLMQSLSNENIKHLKEVVLLSEGVQHLISNDMDELLILAAADKREELKVFSGEVVRFGNRCKDPQWHNLDRFFHKLESEFTAQHQLKEKAKIMMQQLMALVQYTAELYHELHALDRFEQDYRRKYEEEDNSTVQKGDNLQFLRQELKSQKKLVKGLKKKSLWSKNLEEIMEKLVDIFQFLHLEIHDAFGTTDGEKTVKGSTNIHQKLGTSGLALHYANIISQIDSLVPRSSSVPPNMRDTLYQGLPPNIRSSLRSKLQSSQIEEEVTVPQIKTEMEKTLRWLVPIADNTTKAHHGFGWVGEWANTGSEMSRKPTIHLDLIRIGTLHHADKGRTEACILDMVVWLHRLITCIKAGNGGIRSPIKSPIQNRSPAKKKASKIPDLTPEDEEMLREVACRKPIPGRSKSQEFEVANPRKMLRKSSSRSHSPSLAGNKRELGLLRRQSTVPIIDFKINRMKSLDVLDDLSC